MIFRIKQFKILILIKAQSFCYSEFQRHLEILHNHNKNLRKYCTSLKIKNIISIFPLYCFILFYLCGQYAKVKLKVSRLNNHNLARDFHEIENIMS